MSSPIMMVAPTPTRRDHLALNVTACMRPAGSCKASHQWDEQKRSTMHWRSALFNALCEAGLCVCGVQVVLVQEARAPPAAKGASSLHTFEPRKLLLYVYHTTPYNFPQLPKHRGPCLNLELASDLRQIGLRSWHARYLLVREMNKLSF